MKDKLKQLKKEIEIALECKISTPSRKRHLTYARAVFCKIARESMGMTLSDIGKVLNRDHATVMHSIKVVFPFAMKETRFRDIYDALKDEYKPKSSSEKKQESAQDTIQLISKLRTENAYMKMMLNTRDRFNNLFDDLRADEYDEVYNKLEIFVKYAIKTRVYYNAEE
jgi:predicted transcriptional regulator